MANRRLAPASEQPESFAFSPENAEWARTQIAKYPEGRQASAVISLLWRAQEQNGGWLPRAAIEAVAAELGMPNIRVLEVATFYTMFALEPVGRFWIQVCGTVPCDSCGARGLKEMLQARLGPAGHVSADGNFSWLEVECLGACCNAPMVQINQDYYEDLTPESLGQLMDDLRGKTVSSVAGSTNILMLIKANNERKLGITVIAAKDVPEGFLMVETGRAAAFVMDDVQLSVIAAQSKEPAAYVVSEETLSDPEPYGIMLRKDDPAFKAVVDRATADLYRSPEITALYDRWFLRPVPPRGLNYNVPLSSALRWAFAHPTDNSDPAFYAH
ncbi:NADH-quinone oxidoreductase subunit NuoE [Methylobacterium organophilum]|nr:NADH-quinone oxidoreductase subunit NuoE [Methylobacterium organophilum]